MAISQASRQKLMEPGILQKWLRYRTEPAEVERDRLERTAKAFNLPLDKAAEKFGARPFGEMTDKWREFVQRLREKDELWFFSSPEDSFPKKLGCLGYAIVRDGVIIETFVTLQT